MPHAHLCGSFLLLAESLVRTGMKALFYHLRTRFRFLMLHFFLGPLNILSKPCLTFQWQSMPFCGRVCLSVALLYQMTHENKKEILEAGLWWKIV